MNLKELVMDRDAWRDLVNAALNLKVTYAIESVNIPIISQLCYVTMETTWKNTGGFVDRKTILRRNRKK